MNQDCCRVVFIIGITALWGPPLAIAQSPPLEIPFVWDWAASPHARAASDSFTHWDEEGEIPVACASCHSTSGFQDHVGADGSPPGVDQPALVGGGGIACVACHNHATLRMDSVVFPSGARLEGVGREAVCLSCHQGRESTVSVDAALAGKDEDTPDGTIRFINVHYRAAGATRFGTEVKGGYEFADHDYIGAWGHALGYATCTECHEPHTLRVKVSECAFCHAEAEITSAADLRQIRRVQTDFDGDGDVSEGIADEIATLQEALLDAIREYAREIVGRALAYHPQVYPYYFNDNDGDGEANASEAARPNQYDAWTPRLLRSAYNYQYVIKDPGAYAHNPDYAIELLHDSLESLSAKVPVRIESMTRPKPPS